MQFWKTITGTHVSFLIDGKSLSSKRTLHFTFTCFTYSRSLSAYDNRLPNFWKTSFRGHTWRAQKLFWTQWAGNFSRNPGGFMSRATAPCTYNLIPAHWAEPAELFLEFWLLDTWLFVYPLDQSAVTGLKNVRTPVK